MPHPGFVALYYSIVFSALASGDEAASLFTNSQTTNYKAVGPSSRAGAVVVVWTAALVAMGISPFFLYLALSLSLPIFMNIYTSFVWTAALVASLSLYESIDIMCVCVCVCVIYIYRPTQPCYMYVNIYT